MPADENPADPGTDHTPDQTPEYPPRTESAGEGAAEPDTGRAADEGVNPGAETPEEDAGRSSAEGPDRDDAPPADGEDSPETVVIDTGVPVETTADTAAADTAGAESPADTGAGTESDRDTAPAAATAADAAAGAGAGAGTDPDEAGAGTAAVEDGAAGDRTPEADAGPAGKKHRRGRLRRVALWTSATLALVMCAGVATAYGYYHYLRSDMVQHDIGALLNEEERPDRLNDAVNILFIGSDGYEEDSPAYSTEFEGERSDSLMLAHISPDNRASVISFPRDSLVQLPECDAYGEAQGTYGYFGMINAAMYHGGPPCVVRTIETLTDIRVDHFVHLSFASFRDVVDAIGGVDMCIPEPMQDRRAKLDLEAGEQTLDGNEALSFVRARYDIGDGGDMGRIDRQQMFLAALADQATSSDVLTSPSKLNGILQAVVRHSATDRELTLDRMLSVAVTMADVDLADIEFHTVPWYQAPYDPNRVMWNEAEAAELFSAVREDRSLPELLAADDASAPQEPPTAEPTPADSEAAVGEGDAVPDTPARPGVGRDATSDPCQDGLGFGTGENDW
ncbi:hypothetical protein GCM10007079_06620 [Nocardiopsis terrae]|uniref:LCP family protein required for cell wall assembly n=1 Tax=Nocardiopsis terrae TaxID=372655 RepID=A0ABR9HP15_9ACTN|nr:LCP family protein [Nocardiopsis terrae]MBE1460708.1 LCP family protein required for cell wall assembly [Nocardiopsis terrae]GHC73028.1 hypothetical protein GCM10007079_06620 [Nocardiopsis terrae]